MSAEREVAETGGTPGEPLHIDIPEGMKQAAALSIEQMKANYEKLTTNAEALTDVMEKSYSVAVKDIADLQVKMLEAFRENLMASFEFATQLAGARTMPAMIELTTSYARRQFEAYTVQVRDIWSLSQRMVSDTAKPVASGLSQGIDQIGSSS